MPGSDLARAGRGGSPNPLEPLLTGPTPYQTWGVLDLEDDGVELVEEELARDPPT
jgi:hypothetical protein